MNPFLNDRAFLEIPRKDPGYRPREERIRDWQEVECRLKPKDLAAQAARCMECGIPFCFGAGCPLKNPIPEMNAAARDGRWEEAIRLLETTCPFPEITGRICPALCEGSCCNAADDEAVAIRQIEREIADQAKERGLLRPRPRHPPNGRSVAIVGSGPTGLAAAAVLNRLGFNTVVYEAAPRPGGLLRYGIPDFKLDKRLLDDRIELLRAAGIRLECGVTVGADLSLSYLSRKFDGVLLACGAREPRDLKIPGRELKRIYFALDYLTRQNEVVSGERASVGEEWSARGREVVVIGGGDTGSDCVGTAVRQGAKKVTQIELLPKPPESRLESNPWPEWPLILRTSSSHEEGCERLFSIQTLAFEGDAAGGVRGLRCVHLDWHNRRAVPQSGTEFFLQADLVLLALGFTGPDRFAPTGDGLPNIWKAGDMATGPSLVVWAAARGIEAAHYIAHVLSPR